MRLLFFCWLIFFSVSASSQYNFGMEDYKPGTETLEAWNIKTGPSYFGPLFNVDKEIKHSGRQSVSIERRVSDTMTQFTPLSVIIPADFEGRELTISGWLKTLDVKGRAQLWISIADASGTILRLVNFPNLPGITGSADWKQYSFKTLLPEDAYSIWFGFSLVGLGKVWADDLNIMVDGQPLEKMALIKKPVKKGIIDTTAFQTGSGILITSANSFQKENLSLLGKLWGFLKYYHPFVAKGNLNWDYELFRFLPSYLTVKNKKERNNLLFDWVSKLGKPAACTTCSDDILEKAISKPDLSWLENAKELGDSLAAALIYIKHNRHQGKSFYMDLAPVVQNPRITQERSYSQFACPDAGYRLLGLFRYWNLIQYWFPYKNLIGEDWKNVLDEFISRMLNANNTTSYLVTMQQLIGRIHDTHADIMIFNKTLDSLKGRLHAQLKIKFVGEQPVVVQQWQDILPGDIILSVDGKKISDIIKEKLPNLPASNYPAKLRDLAPQLLRGNDSTATVEIKRDGKFFKTTIKRYDPKKTKVLNFWYEFPYQRDSSFFFIRPGIGYINLGNIKKTQVDSVFRLLKDSRGVVIDNRQYPRDYPVGWIAGALLPERTSFVASVTGSLAYPGAFTMNTPSSIGRKNDNYYKGKVIILVNENTQSAAEFSTMAFRAAPNATVIGSTTAGADGDVSNFYLPGGIYTRFSGIGIVYPDGRQTQRVGIVPDILVNPTIEGIKEGRDELVEKAVELINE